MSESAALRCTGLGVRYGPVTALDGVEFTVAPGEMVALLGASGSGKSTLLHAIAGLTPVAVGQVWLGPRLVAGDGVAVAPERRNVSLVFQDFALWPHLTALDTVAYPLRRAGLARAAARAKAVGFLETLGVGEVAHRHPAELSGGQQQRVGLARALARDPQVFLLDEPTAHLDAHLRHAFQDAVRERLAISGAAAIYATHDAGEALGVADRVAVLAAGHLVQVDTPEVVYAEPTTEASAALTGAHSIVPGRMCDLPDAERVLLRPEWIVSGGPRRATVALRTFRGSFTDYRLEVAGVRLVLREPGPPRHVVGQDIGWDVRRAWVMPDSPQDGNSAGSGQALVDHVQMQTGVVLERG